MKTIARVLVALTASVCFSGSATASLILDEILIEQNRTGLGTIRDDLVTVLEGEAELTCPGPFELCRANVPGLSHGVVDIEATSIWFGLGNIQNVSFIVDDFNGFIFSDIDWIGAPHVFSGVALTTDVPGLDPSRVSFGADFVAVNFSGLSFGGDGLSFKLDLDMQPVAEPTTVVLLVAGLAGLGFARWRRRQAQIVG